MDDDKLITRANRWDVYMNNILFLTKGGYYVEVSGSDWKKVIWEVVGGHGVEDPNENDKIVLQGLVLIFFDKVSDG